MSKQHYTEADLLETYYTQPGESMPVMMHLASCTECAARYDRLDRKLREAAACNVERPATFWSRQRLMIMKKVGEQRGAVSVVRGARVAAAVTLAFVLGGAIVYTNLTPDVRPSPAIVTQSAPAAAGEDDLQVPRDPWQSEELEDFHAVVQWEAWVAESKEGASL